MKARKRNTNDDWQEVDYVQLKDSYVITKADQMEFDVPSNNDCITKDHWQDVRERAAIAAMQGTMSILGSSDRTAFCEIAEFACACADALIEQLKIVEYESK